MKDIKLINLQHQAKMNAITSLYIPHVEWYFNAEFIADLFSKNGLAQVSRVYIEPYKTNINNRLNYNRVYIQIESWHETEAAYSFIKRLRNPSTEARLVYSDDNWWAVDINKYPSKLTSNNRVLTVFPKQIKADEVDEVDESCSNVAVGDVEEDEPEEFVAIDAEKTKMLRDIVAKFKENYERQLMEQEEADAAEFEAYLREMDWVRNALRREVTSDMWDENFWYN
jgi:hypothetical protein